MIKSFAKKFYEKIKIQGTGVIEIEKDRFVEMLDEEIENYAKDTQAEVGMGIYKIIMERKKCSLSDSEILKMVENICVGLINKSPECAMEFGKRLEQKHGL